MSKVIIKKTSDSKSFDKVKAHIKYIGFRSQELDKGNGVIKIPGGQFFGKYADHANYKSFINGMENNKALHFSKSIKSHNLVFSLTKEDYDAYKESGKDYKELVRNTLKELEREKGMKLNWLAIEHTVDGKQKSHHPHCHIVLQGVSEPDKEGKCSRVFLSKEDFKSIRENFDKELRREIGTREKEFNVKNEYEKSIGNDIGKGFEMVTKQIQRELQKDQRDIERSQYIEQLKRKNKEKDR